MTTQLIIPQNEKLAGEGAVAAPVESKKTREIRPNEVLRAYFARAHYRYGVMRD